MKPMAVKGRARICELSGTQHGRCRHEPQVLLYFPAPRHGRRLSDAQHTALVDLPFKTTSLRESGGFSHTRMADTGCPPRHLTFVFLRLRSSLDTQSVAQKSHPNASAQHAIRGPQRLTERPSLHFLIGTHRPESWRPLSDSLCASFSLHPDLNLSMRGVDTNEKRQRRWQRVRVGNFSTGRGQQGIQTFRSNSVPLLQNRKQVRCSFCVMLFSKLTHQIHIPRQGSLSQCLVLLQ
ncbi:hypothetical protein LY39_03382 [Roseinatronobacter bogoriensis subsp. barguzinensis]|nr:hypothetical protein LY39_03382 [Rhodobaca barguzinensis]TDY67081.1 hypothetical protein EV660_10882 [Rhodobaca bogoriensis DSM 18756]